MIYKRIPFNILLQQNNIWLKFDYDFHILHVILVVVTVWLEWQKMSFVLWMQVIVLVVGKEKFNQDCGDIMKLLLASQTGGLELADDDPQVSLLVVELV